MTQHLRQAASDIQRQHMIQARFMLEFMTRHAAFERDYRSIYQDVHRSCLKAGGPSLRLANAVWDLEYALRFPKSKKLLLREEASFAGLYNEQGNLLVDPKWCVGKAMEEFALLRNQWRAQAPMAMLGKEELVLPARQELVRLFWLLGQCAQRAYVQRVIKLLLQVNPDTRHHFVPQMRVVADAIFAFEKRREGWEENLSTMKSLLRKTWVRQTEVGDAIAIFQAELNQRLSPS